ncbi:MAG TPA: F0F1 ATP synthase subunit B [Methylomirabilota bacterium]|nr:F0F1 ATP synthase subunit B [Methylomirabilota bacterium]
MSHARFRWLGGIVCAGVVMLVPGLLWAAEGGGGLINLDKSLLVQMVNFLILLLILWRLLYRPLLAKMQERTQAIQRSLEEAQAARAEITRQQEENTARLRQAHAEAASIRERALKDAGEEQKRLLEAARAEAQRIADAAKAQLDAEIRRARDDLRREVAELATAVAEKLVRRSLRDEDHRRVVADAIGQLKG